MTCDNREILIRAVNDGAGYGRDHPAVALTVGERVLALTPNEARRLVVRLERAIEDCEHRRKTGTAKP